MRRIPSAERLGKAPGVHNCAKIQTPPTQGAVPSAISPVSTNVAKLRTYRDADTKSKNCA
ncbi:hypothetical protein [Pyrobaculum sp.]|uniref:hypothetical protein n=1 Tax=Pyrobaculum sp. TaxID=2004705 RepID=UPI003D0CF7F3